MKNQTVTSYLTATNRRNKSKRRSIAQKNGRIKCYLTRNGQKRTLDDESD
jgi:hypothetical protein